MGLAMDVASVHRLHLGVLNSLKDACAAGRHLAV